VLRAGAFTLACLAFARMTGATLPTRWSTDCLAEFDPIGGAADGIVACTDCDPVCDRDGSAYANGSCTFEVAACRGRARDGCTPAPIDRIRVRPALELPPVDDDCGSFGRVTVTVGLTSRTRTVRMTSVAYVEPRRRDRDRLTLLCVPRPPGEACPSAETRAPCAERSPSRNVYFGDLHVHTAYSLDAAVFGTRATPTRAYRFARGEPLDLPPFDATGTGAQTVRLDRPLDFAAVTDHSEFLSEIALCPAADARAAPCSNASEAWRRTLAAADAAYDRTTACAFTTFPAYEYTGNAGFSTRHRNVIFRSERVPFPISSVDEPTPQGLWEALERQCLDAGIGCDVLAIPHNSNESNGRTFFVEYPGATGAADERGQASRRASMEPLIEIYQNKGDSECLNGLSGIVGAPDELCDFEKVRRAPFEDCGDGAGFGGSFGGGCVSRLDYLRGILTAGLREADRIGVNPYRLGVVAGTDTHNATPGAVDEARFAGHRGLLDDSAATRLQNDDSRAGARFGPGGLTAVWAEENTRGSLFDALRRREVYGTSGPRITLRFFGGWSFAPDACAHPTLVEESYATGVPMGASLPPAASAAPSFVVAALSDTGTAARPGMPLERLQIVKGWLEDGEARTQVYDVAGDTIGQAHADPTTCTTSGPGATSLCAVWTDPDFDPTEQAFYYARAIENPTCRWTAHACHALPPDERPDGCTDPDVVTVIQERAWSSPIWYERPG
jgi:hypothetical protein